MMRPFRRARKTQNLAFVAVFAVIFASCAPAASRQPADRPIEVAGDGYVSSRTCRACHPSQYASWHASYHRTMTQVATAQSVATSFDGVRVEAGAMSLEQQGDQLWAEFDDPDPPSLASSPASFGGAGSPATPTVRRIRRQVVLTTGSHNQQIFWYATGHGRTLGQLPAIWLVDARRWIPRRAAVMHPPGQAAFSETGAWNGICVSCHTTLGKPAFDTPFGSQPIATQQVDTTAAEFGVACEACHGPADEHVRLNANPRRRYSLHLAKAPDASIVHPARLDPRRAAQVCAQCHSFWEFDDPAAERAANTRGLSYRPGDDLRLTRFIVQPTLEAGSATLQRFVKDDPGFIRDMFWSDGMVRATGREYNALIESPCYKNAKDDQHTLTCASCHTMHQAEDDRRPAAEWADDQLKPATAGNDDRSCLQCHAPGRDPKRVALRTQSLTDRDHEAVARPFSASARNESARATTDAPKREGRGQGRDRQEVAEHTHHRADSTGSSCMNCHMPYTTYGLLKTIRSHQISNPSVKATLDTGRPNACNLCHLDKTLAWTATYLEQWYRTPAPALDGDQQSVAASVLTLLKGDAGQRAIVAQSLGWASSQQASGAGWMAPYLALMQQDPYDAVRHIATRSRATLPPFRREALPRNNRELLLNADGTFDAETVNRLVRARDNRRIAYRE
jgi:formate-dependent nitrite reductase cytochrome c552 subunit